jgi:hypothetical protein
MGRKCFPLFFENSKVPVWLSKLSPIEIGAITLGPFIFSRGTMSDVTKNHEAIHWEQYKECLILPFLILYGLSWLINRFTMSGSDAYRNIWFEKEAYANQDNPNYLSERKLFAWARKEEDNQPAP